MEAPFTRSALFSIVVALLVSGCAASQPDPIKTKYTDADRRFGQSVDGGFADLREIKIPENTDELTLRASFRADRGISFTFRDPDGRLTRNVAFGGAAEAREFQWVEASPPRPGTWRFGITCAGHCEYAFGFYFEDAVEKITGFSERYADATKRFASRSEGATSQSHEFEIPEGTKRIAVKWSAHAVDGFAFSLVDESARSQTTMRFPDHVTIEEIQYMIAEDPEPGMWRFELNCDKACDYAFGFYFE